MNAEDELKACRYELNDGLVFPEQIRESELKIAKLIISYIDPENQQYVLDYLSERLSFAGLGEQKPIYNTLGYMQKICEDFIQSKKISDENFNHAVKMNLKEKPNE